jgi:hypothetical protein
LPRAYEYTTDAHWRQGHYDAEREQQQRAENMASQERHNLTDEFREMGVTAVNLA